MDRTKIYDINTEVTYNDRTRQDKDKWNHGIVLAK